MKTNKLLSISQFSELSGISRKTLIYYDKIKLFSPILVSSNGYRKYAKQQIDTVSVILMLRELGKSIEDIKHYLEDRSIKKMIDLFQKEQHHITEKINQLEQYRHMLGKRIELVKQIDSISKRTVQFIHQKKEYLLCSEKVDQNYDKAILDFYVSLNQQQVIFGYPIGVIHEKKELLNENFTNFSYYYITRFSDNKNFKPEGLYAVLYDYCGYDQTEELYQKMIATLKENNFVIDGDAYEEYIVDEVAEKDPAYYLVKIMIKVKKSYK